MLQFIRKVQNFRTLAFFNNSTSFATVQQLSDTAEDFRLNTRNIAIIAHVDHGKTTLVDSLLRFGGISFDKQCAMDSNQLQREKGITILSKCTSILYHKNLINIVDTPGHHDFGGQVERVLGMVDGVCLVICATQGPMTQSKFVLRKALQLKRKPIVIINKVDRPTSRVNDVINEIFSMFCDLNCPDEFLDYPLYFASGKNGWAVEDLSVQKINIECILKGIVKHIPPPIVNPNSHFSLLITQTHANSYFGKMSLGRINSGQLELGKKLNAYNQQGNLIGSGKVTKISKRTGLSEMNLNKAFAGDIVEIAGFPFSRVSNTLVEDGYPDKVIESIKIDPPLMGVTIDVNTSPFAGKQGSKLTLNDLKQRLLIQSQNDVALQISIGGTSGKSNKIFVKGRGDLHIGILLEKMRREGFQFSVTPPEIILKTDPNTNETLQPVEKIIFQVDQRFVNIIMDKMIHRKGLYLSAKSLPDGKQILEYLCSTRAMIGLRNELLNQTQGSTLIKTEFHKYEKYLGPISKNPKGAIISMTQGLTTSYTLKQLEKFGNLFVRPNAKVYNGMVIGEANKQEDVEVNPTKQKKLTNIRTHAKDEKINLIPPKELSLEEAICYIREDQLLQVTPKQIRIRKKQLDRNGRERVRREKKNQLKNMKVKI